MPTYQYVCTSCEQPHEAVQGFHDEPLTDCPSCAAGRLRKVYGSVGVVFKGSGFYRTDSRSASSSAAPASGDSGSSSSGASSSGGSSSGGSSSGGSSSGGASSGGSSSGGASSGGSSSGSAA